MIEIPNNEYRISITSKCNMKCYYCHNEGNEHRSELTIDDIRKLIDNSYNLNLQSIRLTGGEPLIHDQIFEICRMIKEDYGLKVGINTNGMENNILKTLCIHGYIDRIVFGLDYFDAQISKQSIVGKSSKEILEIIKEIRYLFPDINITISAVYNDEYDNIKKILMFGMKNNIRVKILEEVKYEANDKFNKSFIEMMSRIIKDFELDRRIDSLNQIQGYVNDRNVVSFFHSHCRMNECDICKLLSLRINSDGRIRTCLFDTDETDYRNGDVRHNITKSLRKIYRR